MLLIHSLSSSGTLNAFLKQKGQTSSEGPIWSLNGNQGDHWKQAKVSIHPTSSFQVRLDRKNKKRIPSASSFLLPVPPTASVWPHVWRRRVWVGLLLTQPSPGSYIIAREKRCHSQFAVRKCNLCEERMQAGAAHHHFYSGSRGE